MCFELVAHMAFYGTDTGSIHPPTVHPHSPHSSVPCFVLCYKTVVLHTSDCASLNSTSTASQFPACVLSTIDYPEMCLTLLGLGPTLEFFTLVSKQLQRKSLGLWRSDEAFKPAIPMPDHFLNNPSSSTDTNSSSSSSSSPATLTTQSTSWLWSIPEEIPEDYLNTTEGLFPCSSTTDPNSPGMTLV